MHLHKLRLLSLLTMDCYYVMFTDKTKGRMEWRYMIANLQYNYTTTL
jgi:hypothetical protein